MLKLMALAYLAVFIWGVTWIAWYWPVHETGVVRIYPQPRIWTINSISEE